MISHHILIYTPPTHPYTPYTRIAHTLRYDSINLLSSVESWTPHIIIFLGYRKRRTKIGHGISTISLPPTPPCNPPQLLLTMDFSTSIACLATGGIAAAYLDAKFHIRKDLGIFQRLIAGKREYSRALSHNRISIWYAFEDQCRKSWNNRAIWSRNGSYTYGQLYQESCRYAQWLRKEGVRPGELVAVYLVNSPLFMVVWFAVVAVGASPALLNNNLQGSALLHCLDVSQSPLLIVDDGDCFERVNASRAEIEAKNIKIAVLNDNLRRLVSTMPTERPPDEARSAVKGKDPFCLLYTRSVALPYTQNSS